MSRLKIGAIPFLNAKPIFYGLELNGESERYQLLRNNPAENALLLGRGELDVALIPSIQYARMEGLWILPGICIASEGPVGSVNLFCKVPLGEVRSIALDERSRTSVALLKLLCKEHYLIDPEFVPMELEIGAMMREHDAAMIIGDASLYCDHPVVEKRDLACDWRECTSYPFVFAFIAGKPGAVGAEQILLFQRSLHQGMQNVRKIAENHPCPLHPDMADRNERYLTEQLNYSFGERELNGLKLFYIKAWEHGLIDGVPRIRFYES